VLSIPQRREEYGRPPGRPRLVINRDGPVKKSRTHRTERFFYRYVNLITAAGFAVFAAFPSAGRAIFGWFFAFFGFV
jgi:hypothetical protein